MRWATLVADVWLKFCGGAALLMAGDAAMNFFKTDWPEEEYEEDEEEDEPTVRKII